MSALDWWPCEAAILITNEKPAAVTIRDRLILVFSTTRPTRRDRTDAFYHIPRAPFKAL